MRSYANPQMLVSTDWVVQHMRDPNLVIAEVDVDTAAYNEGHISGAVGWNWQTQLCDVVLQLRDRAEFKAEMQKTIDNVPSRLPKHNCDASTSFQHIWLDNLHNVLDFRLLTVSG